MKLLVVLCFVLALDEVISAGILRRDVSDKTKAEEDVYGDLDENDGDIQKDQVNYYDDTKDDEDEAEEPPVDTGGSNEVDFKIISKPETFVKEIGSVVRLPCEAASKDELVRVWSKDSVLIYQGTINIANKNNYKLLANGTLEVILESPKDFGVYSCKLPISDTIQPEIEHKVVEQSSPTITALFTNNDKNVFDVGDVLILTCQATGYPKPRVSWHKNGERLGTEGETLTIQNVKAKHAGSYACLADNNIGRPAHKHVEVNINHSPMVSVEKYIVNSDHKSDAELVCEVKAYPIPDVKWQRDGQNIVSSEPKIKLMREKNNERNVLIIKNINENDFGQYSCIAKNPLGKQARNISLVKTPVVRTFEKNISSEALKDVILQWRVESKQPISMHELQYRRKGETSWKTITPEVTDGDNDVYLIKHTLKSLEPGVYETRARSKNSHGWSDYSDIIPFEGVLAKHGSHHPKVKVTKKEQKNNRTQDSSHDTPAQHRSEEVLPVGESVSSSTPISSSIVLVTVALLTIHIRQ